MTVRIARVNLIPLGVTPMLCGRFFFYDDDNPTERQGNMELRWGRLLVWAPPPQDVAVDIERFHFLSAEVEARLSYARLNYRQASDAGALVQAGRDYLEAVFERPNTQMGHWRDRYGDVPSFLSDSPQHIWSELPKGVKEDQNNWRVLKMLWEDALLAAERLTQVEKDHFSLD